MGERRGSRSDDMGSANSPPARIARHIRVHDDRVQMVRHRHECFAHHHWHVIRDRIPALMNNVADRIGHHYPIHHIAEQHRSIMGADGDVIGTASSVIVSLQTDILAGSPLHRMKLKHPIVDANIKPPPPPCRNACRPRSIGSAAAHPPVGMAHRRSDASPGPITARRRRDLGWSSVRGS